MFNKLKELIIVFHVVFAITDEEILPEQLNTSLSFMTSPKP